MQTIRKVVTVALTLAATGIAHAQGFQPVTVVDYPDVVKPYRPLDKITG